MLLTAAPIERLHSRCRLDLAAGWCSGQRMSSSQDMLLPPRYSLLERTSQYHRTQPRSRHDEILHCRTLAASASFFALASASARSSSSAAFFSAACLSAFACADMQVRMGALLHLVGLKRWPTHWCASIKSAALAAVSHLAGCTKDA